LQSKNFANFGKYVGDGQRIDLVMRWISKSSINAMHPAPAIRIGSELRGGIQALN
jgi:hypothetical protein